MTPSRGDNLLARVASARRESKLPRDVERASDPHPGGRGTLPPVKGLPWCF
jgi:hypothetical protein